MNSDEKKDLFQKVNKLSDDMTDVKVILARQESNLETHMKRSDALESHVIILETEFKGIQNRFLKLDAVIKFIGFLGVIAGIYKALH